MKYLLVYAFVIIELITPCYSQLDYEHAAYQHKFKQLTFRAEYLIAFMDRTGVFYLGTSEGLLIYNGNSEFLVHHPALQLNKYITTIAQDNDHRIWLGYQNGEVCQLLDDKIQKLDTIYNTIHCKITKIAFDDNGNAWIATMGQGVFVRTKNKLIQLTPTNGLGCVEIRDLELLPDNRVLISTRSGYQKLQFIKDDSIFIDKAIFPDKYDNFKSGNIALSKNKLIFESGNSELYAAELNQKLSKKLILNSKKEKIIDFTSNTGGLAILTSSAVYYQSAITDSIYRINSSEPLLNAKSILLDTRQTIWILDEKKGLISIQPQVFSIKNISEKINCISRLPNTSNLLIGTSQALLELNLTNGKSNAIYNGVVKQIIPSNEKNECWVIVGTGALIYLTDDRKKLPVVLPIVTGKYFRSVHNDDYIWIITESNIIRSSNKNPTRNSEGFIKLNVSITPFANFNEIVDIVSDKVNNLWISTSNNKVLNLKDDKLTEFNIQNYTWDESLHLCYLNDQHLVLNSSTHGLGMVNLLKRELYWLNNYPKNLNFKKLLPLNDTSFICLGDSYMLLENRNGKSSFMLDEEAGLSNTNKLISFTTDPNKNIYTHTENTIYGIDAAILSGPVTPYINFRKVTQFQKDISLNTEQRFNYVQNQLTFYFDAINYLASDHIQYRYRLIGFDQDWNYTSQALASYSNLFPGNYRLEVEASINDSFSDVSKIDWPFRISKPLWQENWIKFIAFSIFLGLLAFIIKKREEQKLNTEKLKRQASECEFELFKNQINPHFLFNSFNSVIALIEEDKSKAILFTEKLSDYFRNMLKFKDKSVINIEEELMILRDYFILLKVRYPNQIMLDVKFDNYEGKIAPMTMQLLFENAVKHNQVTEEFPLKVTIDRVDDYLIFRNKIRRKKKDINSTGYGLVSIKYRYGILTNESIIIDEANDYFSVHIPIIPA